MSNFIVNTLLKFLISRFLGEATDFVMDSVKTFAKDDLTGPQKRDAVVRDVKKRFTHLKDSAVNVGVEMVVMYMKKTGMIS